MINFKDYIAQESGAVDMVPREQMVQDLHFDVHENHAHGGVISESVDFIAESVEQHPTNTKKLVFKGSSVASSVKGLAVPKHMWEGKDGMKERNEARAKVYGGEHRAPLTIPEVERAHKAKLEEHFSKPKHEQIKAEKEAIGRLQAARHLDSGKTTDKSEKTDTIEHEKNEHGEHYTAIASKGVAGHAIYTSGHGDNEKHHIVNTCPGATVGCRGGTDKDGVADTSKGTCFAPNAEMQYKNAARRRAALDQQRHDPAMTHDYILAHTHSIRTAADSADKKKKQLVVRPNTLNESDRSTRHVLRHLNAQRAEESKKDGKTRRQIISYQYSKASELHDPENGVHVTHSNVGPKVIEGRTVSENAKRDGARIRNTITSTDANGEDRKNEQGHNTPPMHSYLVHNLRRGGAAEKEFQQHVTHVKYWSKGREHHELSDKEKKEGPEGHYDGNGNLTTPDRAHYGHATVNGRRYDYQKQHVLHTRMTKVNGHDIPSDSRFEDDKHMPKDKDRFKTKNGKMAGGIVATSATLSTSDERSNSSFTHRLDHDKIEKAKHHGGEWEIDAPHEQEAARGKEYTGEHAVDVSSLKKSLTKKK